MFTTPRKIWNRLTRRGASKKRARYDRLPLRMESLEGREVPATLFGLTQAPNQQLLIFDSATPGAAVALNITGLAVGESLVGIDFRPVNEQLYGISNVNSKLYQINATNGVATSVGSFGVMPVASSFGMDFNPVVDRIRYTSDLGNNLRINPNNGTLTATDGSINGATTGLNAVAYTNNFAGAMATQLYGINSATDTLYLVNANAGTTSTVGVLGVDTDDRLEMDIAADDGVCYATLTVGGVAKLYTINLTLGTATEVGQISMGAPLIGIAAQPVLNNNPVVTFSGVTQTFDIESNTPVQIDPAAMVVDPDTNNFNGGVLTVSPVAGVAGDVISIQNQGTGVGQVSITGSNVFFEGVLVGMFTEGSDVVPLIVTFNANSTLNAVQAVLRAATFATTDNSLVPNTRMFNAALTDGAGGVGVTPTPQTVNLADLTAPTVVSINRDDSNPTNATTVSYTVVFSENVTGVDATDFKTVFSGVASATVMMVTQNTPSNYTVTVDVGAGMSGTVQLDALADGTIMDGSGNKMTASFMGQVYDIDRIAPIVIVSVPGTQPNPAFSQPVTFLVDFSEPVTGFDATKVSLAGSTAGGMLVPVIEFLGGTMYNVKVSGATSDGFIVLTVANGAGVDAAGNPSEPFFNFGNSIFLNVVNDAPVITAPAAVMTDEDTEFAFTGADTVSIADDDLNGGEIEITLTATNGTIRLGDTTNLTFSVGDGSPALTMTFRGLLADVNAALTTLFFNPDANYNGPATVIVNANDLGNSGSGGPQMSQAVIDVTVNPVNDGPTITFDFMGGAAFQAMEDTVFNFPAGSIVIGDIDAGANEVEVSLTVTMGTLTFGDITGLTFSVGTGTNDVTMTFRGTLADINAALNTLSYLGDLNFNSVDTLTVFVDDLGNNGSGGPLTAMNVADILVDPVNDAPTITAPAAVTVDEDTDFPFIGPDSVSISDIDGTLTIVEITLTATNGTISITELTGLTFITGDGSPAATMTFQGTVADINAALATLVFRGALNFNGMANVTVQATDVNDITLTNMANIDVTVDPVNDAPTITFNNTPFTTNEDTTFTFPAGSVVISDVDGTTGEYEVTLTITNGTISLGTITGLTFTTGTGTDDTTMTFKGTLADINAALDTLSYTPTADFNGTGVLTVTANDQGNSGSGMPLSTTEMTDITVTPVNDGPSITAPAAVSTNEDTQLVFSGANLISVTDSDSGTGSLQVTLSVLHGTITLSSITGLTFTTGDGTADAMMVFTGTLTNINAALNGLIYTPTLNFNGADTLSINVDDQGNTGGGNLTAMQDVAITVNPVNDAPTAVNSSFTTKQNQPLFISPPGILTGATDPEGIALSAILVTDVPAGTGVLSFTGGNATGNGGFTFIPAPNFVGTVTFQFRANDGTLQSNIATVTITVTENFTRLFATGAGEGGGPQVVVYNSDGSVRFSFYAFDESFAGGVRVATGDVNGDGVEDIICAAGPGGTPHIRVFSGVNLAQIHSFMAYDPAFSGGVFVAAGDVNGDGFSDVIVGAGEGGGPHVRVFNGKSGQPIQDFFAYDAAFRGGVSVASADFNADGKSDIVTGAGPGGSPQVIVYSALSTQILQSFYAFDQRFSGGVNVAAGAFNGEPAIFTSAGAGGVPVVSIYDFKTATEMASFFAFDQTQNTGVSIATKVLTGGKTTIFVGSGRDFAPTVRVLDADTLAEDRQFNAYAPEWLGGVFVG